MSLHIAIIFLIFLIAIFKILQVAHKFVFNSSFFILNKIFSYTNYLAIYYFRSYLLLIFYNLTKIH